MAAGPYFFTSPRPCSPPIPSAESSNTIFHLVPNMRQTEVQPGEQRAPHRCIDCGQTFHDYGALVAHLIDCTTADSSDVHWPGSGTAVARRAMETTEGIPGQYVHPHTSAPRYSLPYLSSAMEQTPQSPIHLLNGATKPIDLNLMPSLSSLPNPVGDQNPIGNDPFPQLDTLIYRSSFDADDRRGNQVLVDLNDPAPYSGEFLPLNDLNRNPDPDEENLAPRHETDLAIRDLMFPPSPYRNGEGGLRHRDARNGDSTDPAANFLGVLDHSRPAGASAAVVEDDNHMDLDLTLHL